MHYFDLINKIILSINKYINVSSRTIFINMERSAQSLIVIKVCLKININY